MKNGVWGKNPIDRFVAARLEAVGLEPAVEATPETLCRRVYLDLTGLPPTPDELQLYLNDSGADRYERLVERLLASPRYGEHRARYWLDAARYADTHGLHFDNYREMWPYRDWVINSFNRNQPFDQFTVEQLAGDLLPNATTEQRIATGFHRCNMTTNEGGTIADENLANYARDRVETTSWVWLGLTANCAVCHDHKFDPITTRRLLFDERVLPEHDARLARRQHQRHQAGAVSAEHDRRPALRRVADGTRHGSRSVECAARSGRQGH
ncbi:MAG: DUF1549 domain-containing protein [Pirellulales bacterium]